MKLGVLITRFPDQTSISMWRVASALREMGCEVDLFSTRRPDTLLRCHSHLRNEADRTFYSWPPKVGLAARRMAGRAQGVASGVWYLAGLSESHWSEKLRLVPMIASGAALAEHARRRRLEHVIVHSCANAAHLINVARAMGGPPFSLRLGGELNVYGKDHRSKLANATCLFPAARCNADEVVERGLFPEPRIVSTPLGVDSRRFTPQRDDVGAGATGSNQRLKLVTVARLHPAKGHRFALDALAWLKQRGGSIGYTMVGDGPAEDDIRGRAATLGLEEDVEFTGALDEDRVIEVLRSSDVFVLPSVGIGEASPVAVIEAMSCGLPVVSTVIGGTPDLVADGVEGFLVPQRDGRAMAESIGKLAADPSMRREMGGAARRRAEREYDCRQVAQKMMEAIQRWSS